MNLAETILSSQLDNWIVLLFVAISWKHFFFQLIYRQPVYTGLKMALYVWIFCIFIYFFFSPDIPAAMKLLPLHLTTLVC